MVSNGHSVAVVVRLTFDYLNNGKAASHVTRRDPYRLKQRTQHPEVTIELAQRVRHGAHFSLVRATPCSCGDVLPFRQPKSSDRV